MALGRAFIEVHADLRPFKKDMGKTVAGVIKETQAAVDKAVKEGLARASKIDGRGSAASPTIKPKLDTTDVDRDTDRMSQGFKGAVEKGIRRGFDSVGSVFSSPGRTFDQVTLTLIAAFAAAAPMIAPMIGGAIAAGIGLSGIGAGIALAFQDSRIQAAAKGLGDYVKDGLTGAADVFLGPTLAAIQTLKNASVGLITNFENGFAKLAPYVDDLAQGISTFVDIVGDGLETAFGNSGPFVEIFAEALPMIGDALAYMMEQITASEGARAGLLMFFQLAADLIYFVTDVVTALSEAFRQFLFLVNMIPDALVPDQIQEDVDAMIVAMGKVPETAEGARAGLTNVAGAAGGVGAKSRDATASLNDFFGAALGLTDANIRFESSLDGIAASFKENGRNIDITTAKGRENVTQVQNGVRAAIAMRDAKIKETGSVAAGNAVYSTQIDRLRGVLRNAGLTKGQIDKLIGAYDDIPPDVNTDVTVSGLGSALTQAQALARTLSSINSQRIATRRAASGDGVGGYASGGVVDREQLAWVGEGNKAEAIVPLTNPTRAAEVMAEAGLLGMGGGTTVIQLVLDGKVIDERIVRHSSAAARSIQHQPRAVI